MNIHCWIYILVFCKVYHITRFRTVPVKWLSGILVYNVLLQSTLHRCQASVAGDRIRRRQKLNTRCTRRFTPGVCAESVSPVWTFDFFKQNCTERLGCVNSLRSNRFSRYSECLKKCHAFIDLYTQTLAEVGDQSKRLRSELVRREDAGLVHAKFFEQEDSEIDIESQLWDSPVVMVAEDDTAIFKHMVVPDIDYVGVQMNREECDLLHHGTTASGLD